MQNITLKQKARGYVRVSTLKESQKDSPENQEGLIRETAKNEGVEIEHVYTDKDTATNIIDREDVQRLIEDAKRGEFNSIWFASLSRFSRDTLDAISLKRIIVNALGIRLVSIEDFYDSAKEDNEMIFTIVSSMNQKQSENIGTASKRGIRQSAMKGNFTGSIAPYGYKKVKADGRKTLEVIPEAAEVVREIFDFYVNHDMGEKAIVNYLNDEKGIPSPKGGMWGLSSIQRILHNENYTGYLTFGKLEKKQHYEDIKDLHNRRKKLVMRDEGKWERTSFQTHEPIIDQETFQKARDMRESRGGGKRGGNKAFVNVFAKMIFCKECGSAMVTMSSTKRLSKVNEDKQYRYLMCSKRRRQGVKGCSNATWIPYHEARDTIIEGVVIRLDKFVNMDNVGDNITSDAEYQKRDFDKDIKRIEKVISDNRRLLFETRRMKMLGDITEDQYEFERNEYEKEIGECEKKLATLNKKADIHKDKERMLQDVSKALNILTNMESFDDVEKTRLTLLKLIDRIEARKDGEVDVYTVLGKL